MKIVDMSREPRQAQFEYFSRLPSPHASVTVNCDITHLRQRCKEQGYPFFLSLLYCAVNAANSVPQLRRRLVDGQVVEYETCFSSHTVALEDDSYCYCEIDCAKPFGEYLPYAVSQVEQAKEAKLLSEQTVDSKIVEETGASTTTISRVNRAYVYGEGGYKRFLLIIAEEENK